MEYLRHEAQGISCSSESFIIEVRQVAYHQGTLKNKHTPLPIGSGVCLFGVTIIVCKHRVVYRGWATCVVVTRFLTS